MPLGVLTLEQLDEVVAAYSEFDSFVVDVETMGPHRDDPLRNEVFWVGLAGPGRADAIPCGHPRGERIEWDDDLHRLSPQGKPQERHRNPDSGKMKWFDVPEEEQYHPPPKQLWKSDVFDRLKPLFFSGKAIVGHNVGFDVRSIAKYFGEVPSPPYVDTYVAAKLVNETHFGGMPYSLGTCVKREFGYEYPKIGKKGPEKFPYSEAFSYSYQDAKWTWMLWRSLHDQLVAQEVDRVFSLEMHLLPVLIRMEERGIAVDEDSLDRLGKEFEEQMAMLEVKINKAAGKTINLNAPRQVGELIYDILGHECFEFTQTGERSVAKSVIEDFAGDPVVDALIEHATLRKLQQAFVVSLKSKIVDGRIHPSFNQAGTVSGRLSASNPNVQQIPSRTDQGRRIRDIFVASPGHLFVVSDLSQIELRMLAHFTQDPELLRAYQEDIDLHSLTAERVFGPDFTSEQRSYAKNANFSCLYGSGPKTLVRRYHVPSVRTAQRLLDTFYATFKNVEPWKGKVIRRALRKYKKGVSPPYVQTILGRKRRLPELLWGSHDDRRWAAERQAVSVTISGSAADLFKVIMIKMQDVLDEQEWDGHLLMTIHDELVVEVPERYADEAAQIVTNCMENVDNPFTGEPMLTVPIEADTRVVDRWSKAKGVEKRKANPDHGKGVASRRMKRRC